MSMEIKRGPGRPKKNVDVPKSENAASDKADLPAVDVGIEVKHHESDSYLTLDACGRQKRVRRK